MHKGLLWGGGGAEYFSQNIHYQLYLFDHMLLRHQLAVHKQGSAKLRRRAQETLPISAYSLRLYHHLHGHLHRVLENPRKEVHSILPEPK